jgi:hypothetical protein
LICTQLTTCSESEEYEDDQYNKEDYGFEGDTYFTDETSASKKLFFLYLQYPKPKIE